MSTPLFALTKIQPPHGRLALIARPALEARMTQALLSRRLVLVCAAAGYGKTAALTRLVEPLREHSALAWVSLDEDDDLQRVLACLVAALEPFDPPWRVAPEALIASVASSRAERRSVADALINALGATDAERGVIVLDDLHRIEDPAVLEFLDLLVERLPPRWCVAIASRVDPPLSLARWRAADECAEFREPELRFDHDAVARLGASVAAAGSAEAIDAADVELLLSRTGGWVAGLRLALRSLQGSHGSIAWSRLGGAMDRHVFDYLASEVLDDMPADLRRFLLRCSVLPELSAERCAQVADEPNALALLAEVERRNLFVSALDDRGSTLRLHDLFRDFLEDRLRREDAAALAPLLQRAAATETDAARRIGYLLRAGDWAQAEAALHEVVTGWLTAGLLSQTQRLLEQFPADWRARSARLSLLQGLAAWSRWDFIAMWDHFNAATRIASQGGDNTTLWRAQAYLALSHCQMDRRDEGLALLDHLQQQPLPDDAAIIMLTARLWHIGDYGPADAAADCIARRNRLLATTGDISLWYRATPNPRDVSLPGVRAPLSAFIEQALRIVPDEATALGAICRLMHGLIALWSGDPGAAETRLARADDEARWLGRPRNVGTMLALAWGLLHALRGDVAATRADSAHLLADPDQEAPSPRREKLRRNMQFQALRLAMIAGDAESAAEMVQALGAADPLGSGRIAQRARELTLPAFAAELAQDWTAARDHWRSALTTPDALEWYGLLSEARLRLAAVHLRLGEPGQAVPLVQAVFERCTADGWIGSALLAGPQTLAMLLDALRSRLPTATSEALAGWLRVARELRTRAASPTTATATTSPAPIPTPVRAEVSKPISPIAATPPPTPVAASPQGLSAREREVLTRIAAGDSNKLIARAFDLSPHTVKRHVANILDKLGVATRGQAAAWWRDQPRG